MAEQIRPRGLPDPDDEGSSKGKRKPKKLQRRSYMKRPVPPRRKLHPERLAGEKEFSAMRQLCLERADWRCERCGERKPLQAHHRKLLSQGGPDALSNLASLCAECHRWAHDHPRAAQLAGLIVPSWADPSVRAMFLYDGRLAVPDDEGGYRWEGRT